MVSDPEALVTGQVEGNVVCPGCGETVHLELPPQDLVRRPDFGPFLYARCPQCRAELVGRKGSGRIDWQVRPAPCADSKCRSARSPRSRSWRAEGLRLLWCGRSEDLEGAPVVEMDGRLRRADRRKYQP